MVNPLIVTSRLESVYRTVLVALCPQVDNVVQSETDESTT